jgi:hypothetical protein
VDRSDLKRATYVSVDSSKLRRTEQRLTGVTTWRQILWYLIDKPKEDCPTQADLLFDVLHLKNNSGNLPAQFVQFIE